MNDAGKAVFGVIAAGFFALAGFLMVQLKSQAPTPTVAELFDNYVGLFSLGMAFLSIVIAAAAATRREPPKA